MTTGRGRAGAASVIVAFLRKDALLAVSRKVPFVFEAVSILFVLFEFLLLSKIVPANEVEGGYFSFAVTGLVVTVFVVAGVSVIAGSVRQEQLQGTLEVTLSAGLAQPKLAAGLAAYPIVSGVVRAAALIGIAAAVGARAPAGVTSNWGLATAAVVIGSISFVAIGLMAASLVLVFRQAAAVSTWLLTLLTLAAGATFPQRLLPDWAQTLSEVSPVTQALRLVRKATLEGAPLARGLTGLGVLLLMAAAYGVLALGALTFALRWGRRAGDLAQY